VPLNQLRQKGSSQTLRGILLPITTPFGSDESLDLGALRSNIELWNHTGIKGFALLGSTGERVHLNQTEYLQVIEAAREAVPESLAFIVGAGQQSTRGTIDEIKLAADLGADAVLVITPYFYRTAITQPALIRHYTTVADASPVPVILYSMPALTGIKIEPDTTAELSRHPNIIGLKDSSADVEGFKATVALVRAAAGHSANGVAATRDDFAVLTGNGTVFHSALKAGAAGGILAVGCVAPELCLEIFREFKAGNDERAQALQEKLTPLAQAVTTKYGIGGLKAALDLLGFTGGSVRVPLPSPDESACAEISGLLQQAQAIQSRHGEGETRRRGDSQRTGRLS
jgi:4-hydroxy-2-oxoglutarate aldolase